MTADEIYSKAHEEFKAKNYSAALKILDDLKKFDPNYKHSYYLAATIWRNLNNPVKEYYALEKILPLLDFSSAEGKKFATVILDNLANVCSNLALNEESFKFHKIAASLADDVASSFAVINNTVFSANFLENFSTSCGKPNRQLILIFCGGRKKNSGGSVTAKKIFRAWKIF